ncbi:MAG TPA: NAD-dependent protein deacetylase [Nocardioidaceae bacterium]|nr:NAD-dependent protein deacetylase [Nocardioidaceae bacterium]
MTHGADFGRAVSVLRDRRLLLLSGAGISTDSGIPDYRGPDSPPRTPMTIAQFRSGLPARRRYWARSHVGWQRMGQARPNAGHRALARLERAGGSVALITQNVDGLHTAAGSRSVIDLHGRISDVRCLDCGDVTARAELHDRLDRLNPRFGDASPAQTAPDGDADIDGVDGFNVADCARCGGVLKPDVVFFGENVAKPLVEHCFALVERSDAVLVAGSSLTVLSGFRFVRQAHRLGLPIVIVNRGGTRADDLATVHLHAGCSETLTALTDALS